MDQELQARIAPITSRLWMLAPKSEQNQGQTRQQPAQAAPAIRRRPGQLIRTSA
ncbi:MAG TPA: hypothetical protein VMG60_09465 [Burkholderiaceae bacterium]|nr:hypothetical protein [Burkholderiaceae bacterium]